MRKREEADIVQNRVEGQTLGITSRRQLFGVVERAWTVQGHEFQSALFFKFTKPPFPPL